MYAIRKKGTNEFLPGYTGRTGGTYVEPSATEPPRLFKTLNAAKQALNWWAKGKVVLHYDYNGELVDMKSVPVRGRQINDFEIVAVAMTFVPVMVTERKTQN